MDDDDAKKDEQAEREALEVLRAIANDVSAGATARVTAAKAIIAHAQERAARRRAAASDEAFGFPPPLA